MTMIDTKDMKDNLKFQRNFKLKYYYFIIFLLLFFIIIYV